MLVPFEVQLGGDFVFHLGVEDDFSELISVTGLEGGGDAVQKFLRELGQGIGHLPGG